MIRFPVQPRMVPPEKAARRLGVTMAVFREKQEQLEAQGFPKPDAILGTYCLQAVDNWIDRRAGLRPAGGTMSDPSVAMERIQSQAWAR